MRRVSALPLASLLLVALAGCGAPGVLAPAEETPTAPPLTSQTPTPTPTPSATPTPGIVAPAPTPISPPDSESEVAEGWEEVTVDDWVTLQIPQEWRVEQDPLNEEADFVIDGAGHKQVWLLYGTEGQYAADYCDPNPARFTLLETEPVPEAGRGAIFAATVTPVTTGDPSNLQDKWQFEAGLTTEALVTPGGCAGAFYALYPESGGYIGIKVQEDPLYGLQFNTREAAEAYQTTDEYETLSRIIKSAEILV